MAKVTFLWGWQKNAGLVCVSWRGFALHALVQPRDWQFGYQESWYDGPLPSVGAGPLFLLTWMYSIEDSLDKEQWT